MKLENPLELPVICTRPFFATDPIYYGGVHLAEDYVRMWAATQGEQVSGPGDGKAFAYPSLDKFRGRLVEWRGPNEWRMQIAHLLDYAIPVGVWVNVRQGQKLGRANNTGSSTGPHVHIDFLNPRKMSSEAVWKGPFKAYAHAVSKWINIDLGWPQTPVLLEEIEMQLLKASEDENEVWVHGSDGRRRPTEAEEQLLVAGGVRVQDVPRAQIMQIPESPTAWLSSPTSIPDGAGGTLTTAQLLKYSRTAEETNRIKWQLGEGNFPPQTSPLEAFQKSVREAE